MDKLAKILKSMLILKRTSYLFIFMLLFGFVSKAQQTKFTAIDTLIESTFKENNKCKKIVKGTRRTGTVYFYLKKSGKLLWVESRRQFKTGKKTDSSAVYFYYYINDSLVKTVYNRYFYAFGKHNNGYVYLYFYENRVIERQRTGNSPPDPDSDLIVREAYYYLKHSYQIVKKHRYRKSSQ
ncbi:MAG: hypothetical protein ABIT58_01895 [Ferruginibacter sp.]